MRLDAGTSDLLGRTRIGMLAIGGARLPLVNPAAFHFAGDSLWMTTARHAVKLALARRDPRAAFLVDSGGRAILFQGVLESYDPRSVGSGVRAALEGPGFALSVAGYALKNAAYIGGYLLDIASIPREWWPQNRVVLRLRANRARTVRTGSAPEAEAARVPVAPARVVRALARSRTAYLCWADRGSPVLNPVLWASDGEGAMAWLAPGAPRAPVAGTPAALVVEHHHPFRATRMLGACARGTLTPDAAACTAVADRYGLEPFSDGEAFRLEVARTTWWNGFEIHTSEPA